MLNTSQNATVALIAPIIYRRTYHNLTLTLTVTGVNIDKQLQTRGSTIWLKQALFETPANSSESLKRPSHGGGHEFESRRVHSKKMAILQDKYAASKRLQSAGWGFLVQPYCNRR
jgi:hypothetical protein